MFNKLFTKEKIVLLLIILTFLCLYCLYYFFNIYSNHVVLSNNKDVDYIKNESVLTMMYEIEAGSGEYQVSSDTTWPQNGYTFNATLSSCENGSILSWDEENKKVLVQANTSDKCYIYFDKSPESLADVCASSSSLANCIQNYYSSDGDNDLYFHDGIGDYTNANLEIGDNSYRFSGADPDNYVCFGTDAGICPTENLYRIIGVFNDDTNYKVKLIKNTSAGQYLWNQVDQGPVKSTNANYKATFLVKDSSNVSSIIMLNNTWNETTKPPIYNTLNVDFYNSLDLIWQNKIANAIWQVGGIGYSNGIATPSVVYNYEIGENQVGYEETMKIGLMYVSDYGYAASPESWMNELRNYDNVISTNWTFLGVTEWTITRDSNNSMTPCAFAISESGYAYSAPGNGNLNIRPTFYLNSDVQYVSGSGTIDDPIRIN